MSGIIKTLLVNISNIKGTTKGKHALKDKIAIGTVAGFISGTVGLVFSYGFFHIDISSVSSLHLAASLVVMDILNLSLGGIIWSVVTHLAVSAAFSVLLTYMLFLTGKEYWALRV